MRKPQGLSSVDVDMWAEVAAQNIGLEGRERGTPVPLWLVKSAVSARAVKLFAIMGSFTNNGVITGASMSEMADLFGASISTIDRALAELKAVQAVTVIHARENNRFHENTYFLHLTPPG